MELTTGKIVEKPNFHNMSCGFIEKHLLFIGNERGEVFFYNFNHDSCVKLGSHSGKIICMVYVSSHGILVSGSSDHTIKIWNCESRGELLQTLTNHSNSITCVDYIGDILISSSIDQTFKLYQVDEERTKFGLSAWFKERKFFEERISKTLGWVTCIWSNRIPKLYPYDVLIGDNCGVLLFLNSVPKVDNEKSVVKMEYLKKEKYDAGILQVAVSKNYLIIAFGNDIIVLYDQYGKIQFQRVKWDNKGLVDCFLNYKHNELIIINDRSMFFFDLNKNKYKHKVNLIEREDKSIVKSKKGLNSCQKIHPINDNTFIIETSEKFVELQVKRIVAFKEFVAHSEPIIGLSLIEKDVKKTGYEGNQSIISCSHDSSLIIWYISRFELEKQKEIQLKLKKNNFETGSSYKKRGQINLKNKDSELFCYYHFRPNTIVLGCNSGFLCFFNTKLRKQVWYKPHRNTCCSLVVFKYKKSFYCVSGDFDGIIILCNLTYYLSFERDPIFEKKKRCSIESIISLSYDEKKELIIVGDGLGKIKFYSIELKHVRDIYAHSSGVTDLKILKKKDYLFSSSIDTVIRIWDLNKYTLVKELKFHEKRINLLFLIKNSNLGISTDREGKMLLWDHEKKKLESVMISSKNSKKKLEVTSLVVNEDNDTVYAGTLNGKIIKVLF